MANPQSTESGKWQDLYITQLSYSINLILGMATGAIGFCMSQMPHGNADNDVALQWAVVILMASVFFGVACTLIRLDIFRHRRAHQDYENRLLVTWLFIFQIASFITSVLWLGGLYSGFGSAVVIETGVAAVVILGLAYYFTLRRAEPLSTTIHLRRTARANQHIVFPPPLCDVSKAA